MLRVAFASVAVAVVGALTLVAGARSVGAEIQEIDYATYDARVVDRKGVTTDVKELGYVTGVNILLAYRGEAEVEIPFRLIRTLEIGEFVPETRRAPCTATMKAGKTVALEIDAVEDGRLLRAKADFGEFRIRMGKIRRLDLLALSHLGPD
jgi:hypothetical protein